MRVILLENLRKIGSIGEIIDVKRGFARNYLISKKKALFASKENIKEVEKIKNELSKKDQDKKNIAKEIDEKIKNKKRNLIIPKNLNYDNFAGLSNEVKSKFKKIRPKTMGQALRIDGITPAAVYILLSHLKRKSIKHIA